jgi:anti-sigma regulatory factor (Ser/Thr protein kinase)
MNGGVMDGARATVRFEPDTSVVGEARRWLVAFLRRFPVAPSCGDDAVLVLSELVTNALRHGRGAVGVAAAINQRGLLYVEVSDAGDELPVKLDPDPMRVGGVGLQIVDRLSVDWGVTPFPGGKTVWARLPTT